MSQIKDITYFEKVNCNFSEAVHQKMYNKRYGIKSCCIIDLEKHRLDKELLDLNHKKNLDWCPEVIIEEPED